MVVKSKEQFKSIRIRYIAEFLMIDWYIVLSCVHDIC